MNEESVFYSGYFWMFFVTSDNVIGLGAFSVFITVTVVLFNRAASPGTYTELTANDQANGAH